MSAAQLFVISGPSGAGKGTLVAELRKLRPELALAVSATTRKARPHEQEGVHYYFLTQERFRELLLQDAFVEHAEVHGNWYGTLVSEVEEKLAGGHSLILEIDPQGAFQVKQHRPDARLIFIMPPSEEILERRLRARGTENEEELKTRLHNMHHENARAQHYDAIVINDELGRATNELLYLINHYEEE